MEALIQQALSGLAGGLVSLIGVWAVYKVQRKATKTEETFGVSDRWQGWAVKLEARLDKAEAELVELRPLRTEVGELKTQVEGFRSTIEAAVGWIVHAIAVFESMGVPHPPLPERIAQLVAKNREDRLGPVE